MKTSIVVGVVDTITAPAAGYAYDTQNTLLPNYMPISKSYNRLGGAELSYAFWRYKSARIFSTEMSTSTISDDGLKPTDTVILLKGNPLALTTPSHAGTKTTAKTIGDVITKCPLIKLDGSTDRLTVEFNTSDDNLVNGILEGAAVGANQVPTRSAYASKVTVFGLNDPKFVKRWFHVAVVLRDNNPANDRDRHIQARVFINGENVFDQNVVGRLDGYSQAPTTLRQNNGFVYVLPTIDLPTTPPSKTLSGDIQGTNDSGAAASINLRIADVWHANYALDESDVEQMYKRGLTKQKASTPASALDLTGGAKTDSQYTISDSTAWKKVQTA